MQATDFIRLTLGSVFSQHLRSFLTALGIAVGVAAVVLLTSIGEGVHRFVLAEFSQFGTNILAVTPGKNTTFGMSGAVINTVRPLTMEDAEALKRIADVEAVVSVVQGNAEVEFGKRSRRTMIIGAGHAVPAVWQMDVKIGRFLPDDDPRNARAFAVLGSKMADELFGSRSPLGEIVRIASERFRVIGVMESKGTMLGFDLDDTLFIPAGRALEMFNREGVMEIDLLYRSTANVEQLEEQISRLMQARHGYEDFTIITQEEMLETLGSILDILTLAVGALGDISLLVGGVGILTIMSIAVNERTHEIGLLRALGTRRRQVLGLFLGEAVLLSATGGFAGLVIGAGGAALLGLAIPALPVHTPWYFVLLAELMAVVIGVIAGVAPARRAASLDPVEALRAE
ncbi:ABC transporter permease [Solemya velum gill symbiont]|uniref:ABC transporter permease n=1 Tax=Solemya velum gill symbiont TaxID=2340 RepID=UPI000997C22A|nr:ABC transporter permease [Solemya velum gill symbiont]OOZ09029.1 peptide ABC transporter permease [Solemya velum gill symbiont]